MRNRNWNRQYRFEAVASDGSSFVLGESKAQDGTTTHISFSFQKTKTYEYNKASFSFWNLSDDHIDTLADRNCKIKLYAGYGNERPLLFQGIVINSKTTISGGDRVTSIEVADTFGTATTVNFYMPMSYRDGTSLKTMIDDVAKKLDVPVHYSSGSEPILDNMVLKSFSTTGDSSQVLTDILSAGGLCWNIQDGQLHVSKNGEPTLHGVTVISNDYGLIGIPEREYQNASTNGENDQNTHAEEVYGWRIKCFLDQTLTVDSQVYIKTEKLEGLMFVYAVTVSGDNLSGDWTCEAQLHQLGWVRDRGKVYGMNPNAETEDKKTVVLGNQNEYGSGNSSAMGRSGEQISKY